jgi:phage gpG-like protein
MFSISLEGEMNLIRDLEMFKEHAGEAVKRGVDRTAIAMESDAKTRLEGGLGGKRRILTNRLRASVHAELKEGESHGEDNLNVPIASDEAVVGTPVVYANRIEFGFKGTDKLGRKYNQDGMSYMGFAAVKQAKEFVRRVEQELNKLLSKT